MIDIAYKAIIIYKIIYNKTINYILFFFFLLFIYNKNIYNKIEVIRKTHN